MNRGSKIEFVFWLKPDDNQKIKNYYFDCNGNTAEGTVTSNQILKMSLDQSI